MATHQNQKLYSPAFFDSISDDSTSSAKIILAEIKTVLRPRSLLDVGCGTGVWVKAAKDAGIQRAYGIDGVWVSPHSLKIDRSEFAALDVSAEFDLRETFDVVLSLEVAEHLDANNAKTFIGNLVRHAPLVVFSAAIPFQGGTDHRNEQWPEYWANLFGQWDYKCVDWLRFKIWNNDQVAYFYRQNIMCFVAQANYELLLARLNELGVPQLVGTPLPLVHPVKFTGTADLTDFPYPRYFAGLPEMVKKTLTRGVAKFGRMIKWKFDLGTRT